MGRTRQAAGNRRSAARRGRAVIASACFCLLLAGCGAGSAPGARPLATGSGRASAAASATASAGLARTPASAGPARTPAAGPAEFLDLVDLAEPGFGLAGLGTGPQTGGYARLVASSDFGRSFTVIGPRTAVWTASDDVFFLSRQDGWYAVFNVNTLAETLYRTTDGGRSWSAFAAPGHNMAAGSGDTVQFVTPARGWLTSTWANAPGEVLYETADGGRDWHLVASLQAAGSHGSGVLPEMGQVRFVPGSTIGWLGGSSFCRQALYRTGDGGRTWQRARVPAPAGSQFGLPAGSGQVLMEPVTLPSGTLALYRSTDGGTRWSRVSVLPGAETAATSDCTPPGVPASFPTLQDGWAAAVRGGHTVVYRTTDGGRHWAMLAGSWPAPFDSESPVIQGESGARAWLVTGHTESGPEVYATVDGGATWRRIDTAANASRVR
jgi:photosystem II stability/assembly factor-like uncharacterized protein